MLFSHRGTTTINKSVAEQVILAYYHGLWLKMLKWTTPTSWGVLPGDLWRKLMEDYPKEVLTPFSRVSRVLRDLVLLRIDQWVSIELHRQASTLRIKEKPKTRYHKAGVSYRGLCVLEWNSYNSVSEATNLHVVIVFAIVRSQGITSPLVLGALGSFILKAHAQYLAHPLSDHLAKAVVPLYPPNYVFYRAAYARDDQWDKPLRSFIREYCNTPCWLFDSPENRGYSLTFPLSLRLFIEPVSKEDGDVLESMGIDTVDGCTYALAKRMRNWLDRQVDIIGQKREKREKTAKIIRQALERNTTIPRKTERCISRLKPRKRP